MNHQIRSAVRPFVLSGLLIWMALTLTAAQWNQTIGGRISVVWMHDGQGRPTSIRQSRAVNLAIWPMGQVGCSARPNITLLMALNNEPTSVWGQLGQPVIHTGIQSKFPAIEFDNIPADMSSAPAMQIRFIAYVSVAPSTQGFSGNVWVHAIDPRTNYPEPMVASGFSAQTLPAQGVDTRIQIVWAHDEMGNPTPVNRATRLNITVEVFEHGTTKAIPPNPSGRFDYVVSLWVAEGNNSIGMAKYSSVVPMTYTEKGQAYTRWHFNDVPVQPGGQYHFLAGASAVGRPGVYPHASIWTHAADARTAMPNPQEPPPCVP